MKPCFIFLDIDGTLINVDQRPTIANLPSLIDELSDGMVHFGLNSNRAREDVLPIIREFHLTGPFILENGAYLLEDEAAPPILQAGIPTDIPQIVERAFPKAILPHFPQARVQSCDTVKLIVSGEKQDGVHFYLNGYRRYSASIHGRFDGNMDAEKMRMVASVLQDYFVDQALPLRAVSHEHGASITIELPQVNKGTGLILLRKLHPNAFIIAIGDGIGDVALQPFVDRLYAVSNGVEALKRVANHTATQPMTAGVYELLDQQVRKDIERLRSLSGNTAPST